MLAITLTNASAEPRAVVIVRRHALLTHAAVARAQRHVYEALRAVAQANLNLARALASLHRRQVLLKVLLRVVLAVTSDAHIIVTQVVERGDCVQMMLDHMLARAVAHLPCVLNGHDVVVHHALGR